MTPGLTNAISTVEYLRNMKNIEPEVLEKMHERRDNLEQKLRSGQLEVQVLFLKTELDEDFLTPDSIKIDRYSHLLEMLSDPTIDLEARVIPTLTRDDLKQAEATYALIYNASPTLYADAGIAYASQATQSFFELHILEINTDRVKEKTFQFQRLWSCAWSEQKSKQYIEQLVEKHSPQNREEKLG